MSYELSVLIISTLHMAVHIIFLQHTSRQNAFLAFGIEVLTLVVCCFNGWNIQSGTEEESQIGDPSHPLFGQ